MNILFCHNSYQSRSGEDIVFDEAVALLRRAGHSVHLFTRSNREISTAGPIAKLKIGLGTVNSAESVRQLQGVLRDNPFDLAIVQNVFPLLSPAIYPELKRAALPVVQLLFNYRLMCLNGQFFTYGMICERCKGGNYLQGVIRRCYRDSLHESAAFAASIGFHRLRKTWLNHVDRFVAPDQFLKQKFAENMIPEEMISVVPNPIDPFSYHPLEHNEGYALFVGRLVKQKGIFTLLEAACGLAAGRLIKVIGSGEEENAVKRHPAVLQGKVEFLGPRYAEEMLAIMAKAAFVVIPSEWYDNLPMVACQAMALGKPIVASEINGIPEYVIHQRSGVLFPPGNANALREACNLLFEDQELQARLGAESRRQAETVLSPDAWIQSMDRLFKELTPMNRLGGPVCKT